MSIFDVLKILYCESSHTYHIQPTNQIEANKANEGFLFLTCDIDRLLLSFYVTANFLSWEGG